MKKPTYEELKQRIEELEKGATKLKHSDSALKESDERYRAIVAAFDGLIYICSQDYRVEFMNDNFIERTGYDATGERCYKALHDFDSVCPWCVNEQVFRGETVRWEVQSPKDNCWYYVVNTPIYRTDGSVSKQAMIFDITDRKQMEVQLRNAHNEMEQRVKERTAELVEADEELKQLFQTVTDAIMLFDAKTRKFINVNEAASSLYGYSREEFLKLRHQDITAEPENSDVSIRQTLEGKLARIPVRYHKKKDGTIFPVEISASTFTLRNRKVLCGIIRDITERKKIEEALQEREQVMKAILSASPVGIVLVRNRMVDWANSAMRRIWGFEEGFLLGKSTKMLYPDAEEYERVGREFYSEIEEKGVGQVETRWVTKDGREIHCYTQGSPLDPSDLSKGVIVAAMDITERKRAEDLFRNLSQILVQVQERERRMISCELHDSIAQNLSKLKIDYDLLFDDQPAISHEIKAKMKKYSNLIDQTIKDIRNLAYDLRPPLLDEMGLIKALQVYCEDFSDNNGVKVKFQSVGLNKLNFDSNTKIHLYRLVQEGLNNIRKHADATQVTIKIVGAPPNIILRIEDNGKGFDVRAQELKLDKKKKKRMGIRSMKERVNLLGGQMTIQSHLMKGTKIFITYPIHIETV